MSKAAEAYGVKAMQGTLMHQMKRYVPSHSLFWVCILGLEDKNGEE